MSDKPNLLKLTANIVAAYVSHNNVTADDVPRLIERVHAALQDVHEIEKDGAGSAKLVPAVPIDESVTDDHIICLEDGEAFKSLKRHLRTAYDMSPEEYRLKWGLPADYPMVAPNYAQTRSDLAKQMGLGQKTKTDD